MTTINTIEDLIRLLDENPEWIEALRKRLLTRDLLELPAKFDRFVEETNARFDRVEASIGELRADVSGLQTDVSGLRAEGKGMRDDIRGLQADGKEMQEDIKGLRDDVGRLQDNVGELQADGKGMRDDIRSLRAEVGTLKGWRAWDFVREDPSDIAEEMGLTYVKSLRRSDLTRLVRFSDIFGIEPSDLQSFRLADLIMEATDQAGETCYIAVEISFTVDERDTDRAIRNSAFLTRFTGQPSYPAVSGIYRDNRIDALTESGEVFWYQLPREIMVME